MFLVNHEPWSLLDRFHQQLSSLSYSDSDSYYSNTSTGHWRPAVDIKEEKDRFLIIADVPGVSPTDIEIMMENGVLTIKGERHSQMEEGIDTFRTGGSSHVHEPSHAKCLQTIHGNFVCSSPCGVRGGRPFDLFARST